MSSSLKRQGFTLIELLVVVAIVGVLVGMLFPAIQKMRESASRMHCASNFRQIGLAMHMFEGESGYFPPARSDGPNAVWPKYTPRNHGLFAILLPYLEKGSLLAATGYNFEQHWDAAANRAAAKQPIKIYQCPSTPAGNRFVTNPPTTSSPNFGQAVGDYAPVTFVETNLYTALGIPAPSLDNRGSMMQTNRLIRAYEVTDGLSYSLSIVECANRPARILGQTVMLDRDPASVAPCNVNSYTVGGAGWADNASAISIHGADKSSGVPNGSCIHPTGVGRVPASGTMSGGRCVINCTNWAEIYSYHPGGSNVLFGDTSVRFLRTSIDPKTLIGLVTKTGSENLGDY